MPAILKYIILTGLRDKLYISIFCTLFLTFAISIFLGTTMFNENIQTTIIYIAGTSRIILVSGIILFVCITINRAFYNKEIEFILSKEISREKFIFCYLIGFLVTSILLIAPLIIAISLIAKTNFLNNFIWLTSLFLELSIVILFSLLTSLIIKNSLSAIISSIAFYAISRLMGVFVIAIKLPEDFTQIKTQFLPSILKIISVCFPRLDLFTQSKWLIYGVEDLTTIKIIILQSIIYFALLLFMSFYDFRNKEF